MKLALNETLKEVYSVILKDLSSYGGFPFYGVAILAALLYKDFNFAWALFASLVVVTAVVAGVRLTYFKPRPGMPRKKYTKIYERIDNSSFPSIHAARSVMISFAIVAKMQLLLPVAALLVVAVCLSRIHFKRHDWKDILVGLAIGCILGVLFF